MTNWLRAVGVQLSRAGFIAVVPNTSAADSAGRLARSTTPPIRGIERHDGAQDLLLGRRYPAGANGQAAAFPLDEAAGSRPLPTCMLNTQHLALPPFDLHIDDPRGRGRAMRRRSATILEAGRQRWTVALHKDA
jgi:hypothetical protein